MNIKLNYGQYVKREIVDAVNDGQYHDVILTTNALSIEKDRRDARYIKTIRDIRIVYGLKSGGCLILGGNLGCSFVQPLGGEFFVKKAYIDEKTDFNSIKGVHTELVFSNNPMSISEIQSLMEKIVSDDDFVFNLSQFDEFMDIFQKFPFFTKYYTTIETWKCKYRFSFLPDSCRGSQSTENRLRKPIKNYRLQLIFISG